MKNNKKYSLGGGISSLIFAHYNPDFTIVTPEIGGLLKTTSLNLTWMHRNEYTEDLVKKLKIPYSFTKTRIGYYYNGYVHDTLSPEIQFEIVKRKMTDCITGKVAGKLPESINLSVSENYINTINVDFKIIFDKLVDECKDRIILDHVDTIKKNQILLGSCDKLEYDELVSSIPAPIFWKLYGQKREFETIPVTFVSTWDRPFIYNERYAMIYTAEDYLFNRLSKRESLEYTYEFTGEIPETEIKKYLPNVKINTLSINKMGRLIPVENKPPQENITFIGRFAEWLYDSKIQNVIKIAKKYGKRSK